jgi:hypothetical protein
MKKTFIISAFLLLSATLFAQTYVIPKGGLSVSKFNLAENNENVSAVAGFTAGVAVNIKLGTMLSLQPELLYSQKGGSLEFKRNIGDGILETTTTDVTINYLELPLLAKAMFGNGAITYYVAAGPSIGYGLGGKTNYCQIGKMGSETVFEEKAKGEVRFGDAPEEYHKKNVYLQERIDMGVQFGGGIFIANKVLLDVRYGLGLKKLDNEAQPKNNSFQVTVGVPILLFE